MKNWFFLLMAAVFFGCSNDNPDQVEATAESEKKQIGLNADQIRNAGVTVGSPELQKIGVTVYSNGTIEVPPQNKTVIAAQFGGFVKDLKVLDGMDVRKGQTLLTIEHAELIQLQQDYLEVQGNLEFLKSEFERQQVLYEKDAGSARNYQQAKAQYSAAKAQKSGLKAKLEMAGVNMARLNDGEIERQVAIKAPFNGVVTKVNVNVGAYAEPTEHLLELIDLKHSHAEVIVFEKDIQFLQIGQKVKLNFATDKRTIDASIFLIGKEIGKDRTVKVHCHLNEENNDLAPGSYFKATIYTGENEQLCVPSQAIVEMNGKAVVFVPAEKRGGLSYFKPIEVAVLAVSGDVTAIRFPRKSTREPQKVVTKGAYDIMSAMLVSGEEE